MQKNAYLSSYMYTIKLIECMVVMALHLKPFVGTDWGNLYMSCTNLRFIQTDDSKSLFKMNTSKVKVRA